MMGRFKIIENSILWLCLLVLSGCDTKHSGLTHHDYDVWGVDISRHQKRVDWDNVLENNAPYFVFLKATEGTLIVDPTYEKHAKELDERGVLWGAYHFFGHRTSGKEQARAFIKNAKLKKGNLIPVLDIEKHRFMTDPRASVREAKAFCKEIKRYYGVEPIIYCSTLFYEAYLKEDFKPKDYIFWIADYRGNPHHLPWHFWQHTETYKLNGISGRVDRNVFGGSAEQLRLLILK